MRLPGWFWRPRGPRPRRRRGRRGAVRKPSPDPLRPRAGRRRRAPERAGDGVGPARGAGSVRVRRVVVVVVRAEGSGSSDGTEFGRVVVGDEPGIGGGEHVGGTGAKGRADSAVAYVIGDVAQCAAQGVRGQCGTHPFILPRASGACGSGGPGHSVRIGQVRPGRCRGVGHQCSGRPCPPLEAARGRVAAGPRSSPSDYSRG